MNDEFKFKCQQCGKLFEPDPDSMVEMHWTPQEATEAEAAAAEEDGSVITAEQLAAMSPDELEEMGLTEEAREKMLRGEEVAAGGLCICTDCQDQLSREQHGPDAGAPRSD